MDAVEKKEREGYVRAIGTYNKKAGEVVVKERWTLNDCQIFCTDLGLVPLTGDPLIDAKIRKGRIISKEGLGEKRIFRTVHPKTKAPLTLTYGSTRYRAMVVVANNSGITPEEAFKKNLLPGWNASNIRSAFNWLSKLGFSEVK